MEFNEAQLNLLERMRSIHYQVSERQEISKSITEDLSNSVGLINKTGDAIKNSLKKEVGALYRCQAGQFTNMERLVGEVGMSPESSFEDYGLKDWRGKIPMPKKYCNTQIYKDGVTEDQKQAMFEYNNMARKYVKDMVLIRKIQTILNSLVDGKSYKITVDVASKLGF